MMAIKQLAISVPLHTEAIRESQCFTPSSFRYILHSWSQRSRWRSRRRHSYNQCRRRTEQLRRKERVLHLDQPFCSNEVSNWPCLDDKETVILELARRSCVFYEWVERCETGKAWDLLCKNKKKKMFFEKYALLFDTSFYLILIWSGFWWFFFFFNFSFFLPSQTWVSVDCRKFCALFFHFCVCFPFSFLCICFSQNQFFPSLNLPFFGIDLLGFLRLSPHCCRFLLSFVFVLPVTAFCSKFSCIKGKPAQFRFHSSEFSVSMMHSSLLS